MIFTNTSQLSPTFKMTVDGVPIDYLQLQRVNLELNENMHDVAVLEFTGLDPETIHLFIESAITFSIELPDRTPSYFHGYIIYIEPTSVSSDGTVDGSPFQVTRVYCFGASYRMKGLNSRVWENMTLANIATSLAEKHLFSVSVPVDNYTFPRLVQSGQSDWSFLVDSAVRLGYNVSLHGTHIHIWDSYKALTRKISYSPLYTLRGLKGNASPYPGQILSFEGRIGNVTTDGARSVDTIHTLTKEGEVLSVSNQLSAEFSGMGAPVLRKFSNTLNVNSDSFEMSEKLVTGAMRRKFPMTASVTVSADPSISPGGVVRVNEFNAKFDGYWYVRGVRHELFQTNMLTHLSLAKDSLNEVITTPLHVSEFVSPPNPAFVDGSWVSERGFVNVYE